LPLEASASTATVEIRHLDAHLPEVDCGKRVVWSGLATTVTSLVPSAAYSEETCVAIWRVLATGKPGRKRRPPLTCAPAVA
jgi:hypothetical protein